MSKKKYLQLYEIYDSGILSSGPAIIHTVDGVRVGTSDDE